MSRDIAHFCGVLLLSRHETIFHVPLPQKGETCSDLPVHRGIDELGESSVPIHWSISVFEHFPVSGSSYVGVCDCSLVAWYLIADCAVLGWSGDSMYTCEDSILTTIQSSLHRFSGVPHTVGAVCKHFTCFSPEICSYSSYYLCSFGGNMCATVCGVGVFHIRLKGSQDSPKRN